MITKIKFTTFLCIFGLLVSSLSQSPPAKPDNKANLLSSPDKIEFAFDGIKWHTFEGQFRHYELQFYDDGVCSFTSESSWYFWDQTKVFCLIKNRETNEREFFICDDAPKCSKVGNVKEVSSGLMSYIGLASPNLIYKADNQKFASEKETLPEKTLIKFYSKISNTKRQIARIEIEGQGSQLQPSDKVIIYRFTKDVDMKWLLLVAAQNLNSYSKGWFTKKLMKYATSFGIGMVTSYLPIK